MPLLLAVTALTAAVGWAFKSISGEVRSYTTPPPPPNEVATSDVAKALVIGAVLLVGAHFVSKL